MVQLREYQQRAINELYAWFSKGNKGNPCLVLPTGAGKSHIVAALCKDALMNWPETRLMMLTHQRELISQNYEKMRQHWPNAPVGIYSAGLGRKQLGEPITFAGIQSIRNKAADMGHVDLVIIDECHLVGHKAEGGYRDFLAGLLKTNPAMRVIGLTATPYRLGHGLITDKPAIFDDLIEPVTIEELIHKGFLSELRSKVTSTKLDTTGVQKRGGEFVESDLQKAVNTDTNNAGAVDEVIRLAGDRKCWLFFCSGVDHAMGVRDVLRDRGVTAECVTGATTKGERDQILSDFKAGKITALTNANVLTTGFDHPGIDLIAMLRPTMSPALYVQMAGRGLRIQEGKTDCLVLDFAGVVETHGPITAVEPPKKGGEGTGDAPVKVCDQCAELVHPSALTCPSCGFEFPPPEPKKLRLRDVDIMGIKPLVMPVTGWAWSKYTSRTSGKDMIKVTYYGNLSDKPITEYLCVTHSGYAEQKAFETIALMVNYCGADIADLMLEPIEQVIDQVAVAMQSSKPPVAIEYKNKGKFSEVVRRHWNVETP